LGVNVVSFWLIYSSIAVILGTQTGSICFIHHKRGLLRSESTTSEISLYRARIRAVSVTNAALIVLRHRLAYMTSGDCIVLSVIILTSHSVWTTAYLMTRSQFHAGLMCSTELTAAAARLRLKSVYHTCALDDGLIPSGCS
jgi:hypothetical protein